MSELDLYAKYLDLGVRLVRSGEDLSAWVEDKVRQDMERSDRQIERERKREEMELQKKREEMKLQKQREEMELQKQKEEMELQKRREEIALQDRREERELKRLELEAETKKLEIGSKNNADGPGPRSSYSTQRPKIPPLLDPSQVDLYLERFERHATAFGWHESEWASCLSNLLQDEALSIFLSLSPAEGSDYQTVKRVLLQRFGCDRNGFRSKFLSVKPQEADDFGTFINRARRYFDKWVELSGVTTLEGLSYLLCSEIALQACDEDFVAYVKDRSPSDMVSLKTVASAYMDARPNKSFRRKQSISFAAKSEPYHSTVRVVEKRDGRGNWSRPRGGGSRSNYSSKGHRSPSFQGGSDTAKGGASRSPFRDRNKSNVASKNVGQGHFRPSSSSGSALASSHSNVTCYQCGGRGHVRRECPSRPKEANSASLVPELPSHCCAAKMDCNPRGGLKIESCRVFDRVSTLLRDSGCNTVGVSKSLVPPDCYTGKSMLVNTFCCKNKLFPTCIINIKTPYISGNVEACLLDSPIADAILGNINGLSSENPLSFDSNSSAVFPNSSIACVVTRAQASKASVGNNLPISNNSTHFNVLDPFSDLPVRQREDPSLKPWFERVGLPPVAGVSFRIEDGILKRLHAKSEFPSVQTTIAVPESLRQVVLSYAHESDLSGHSEPTAYVSAISEEDGGEIGSLVATPPLASENGSVVIDPSLSASQVQDVKELLLEFQDILTSAPGCTNTLCHEMRLTTDDVIRVKPYPLPFAARDFVTQEVNDRLSLGVIEPSDSPYCFPIVVVKKKDGFMRLCIDFRKLNAVTVFDAENIPRQEDLFNQLSHATIFSSCDLCKAYWQVPLHPDSRKYTAFQTPLGLMQWVRMPFGLVTAPAIFCRLMRLVIGQTPDLLSYFDDALVFATSWQQHILALRTLLTLLRLHGLHVNPSKLSIGSSSVEFLGHMVSSGTLVPVQKKMDKILQLSVPVKKKEVRSLLGLVNYYRHFIANFALISAPLSDLLRKGTPEKVQWTPRCDQSLAEIKRLFSSPLILIIPDMQETFIVRSDASDYGIGAVLLQDRDGTLMPCRYASRKLLPRECRYSAIEREALALVFAVTQFQRYLFFKHFVLQTDHKPLAYLRTGSPKNARLMRWAWALQEFSFQVVHIPGSENVHADVLSRLC
ncbi:reverse transcriptase [Plakobranchus ocellatus]|uniref:Reverse transcriptase n=1 Tax=Plakobranchus ocellatus TaxID=259542 RepID=A0AAV4CSZ6_9GAST|nr:reverse transcriptase [Plakobranchus ocellatus]